MLSVLRQHPGAVLVLDAQFETLARLILAPEVKILLYPRKEISRGQKFFSRLSHYWKFLRALRSTGSDTVLDLEGERFTGVLARLSGCKHRVGPTGKRAETFYTDIRDPNYQNHRFNSFGEIVAGYTDGQRPDSRFSYAIDEASQQAVTEYLQDWDGNRPLVAIHPGASVSYKLWPRSQFVELVKQLESKGCQVAWVGAGDSDSEIIDDIRSQLAKSGTINLCNRLNFVELTALYKQCTFFVGSDSGPMHLAASTGLPVFALFGPSDEAIWAPLGDNSHLVRSEQPCGQDCNAFQCSLDYRCMKTLGAEQVVAAIEQALPGIDKQSAEVVPVAEQKLFSTIPVSVYIITLNEAANIGACLDRLVEFDEVVLVDSGSTDGTVEIASQYPNVKASSNVWEGFSAQKSHALSLCENEWVLNVDADEIITDEYIEELKKVVTENRVDALESARILYRWGSVPRNLEKKDRLIRLFRKSSGKYLPRRVHESISIEGEVARSDAIIEHYENLTYTQRIDKANKYSQARAEDKFEKGARGSVLVLIFVFPLTFIQMYFIKGHFLDGVDGLLTSMNSAFYAFMKYAKLWELKKGRGRKQ